MTLSELRAARRAGRPIPIVSRPSALFGKPGSCLKSISQARYGIPSCDSCHELAEEMDRLGPEACRDDLERLAERFRDNVHALMTSRASWRRLAEAAARHPMDAIRVATGYDLGLYKELILEACDKAETR